MNGTHKVSLCVFHEQYERADPTSLSNVGVLQSFQGAPLVNTLCVYIGQEQMVAASKSVVKE